MLWVVEMGMVVQDVEPILSSLTPWRVHNTLGGGGMTDGTGVGGALSNGRVKRESDGNTSGDFVHSNASHEQLRPTPFACLTEREYEVARLVAEGLDNREIAATAYLSEGTVRNNISSILSKMSLKNRTQIAVAYYKSKGSTR